MKSTKQKKSDLSLLNEYSFDVIVSFNPNKHHIGKLDIANKLIQISFTCESDSGQNETFEEYYEKAKCRKFNINFLLLNLHVVKYGTGILDYGKNSRGFYTGVYNIEYVIEHKCDFFDTSRLMGFSLKSNDINRWVGNTHKQEKIIEKYFNKEPYDSFDTIEFATDIGKRLTLGCSYPINMYGNSPKQKAGIKFNPILFGKYKEPKNIVDVINDIKNTISLFSFLIGKDIRIKKISLDLDDNFQLEHPTLYYINNYKVDKTNDGVLFPLGTDLRFNFDDLPEFPIPVFSTYFRLSEYQKDFFAKYLNLSRLSVSEDKFLSIFRIVEKMCYHEETYFSTDFNRSICNVVSEYCKANNFSKTRIKGYLSKLKQLNTSKFNTETNITSIYKKINDLFPEEVGNNSNFINEMVKLRNDITHLNEYSISENTLYIYISFLNIMARYQLMGLLEIDDAIRMKILKRAPDYNRLKYLITISRSSC